MPHFAARSPTVFERTCRAASGRRRIWYGLVVSLLVLGGFGAMSSPYDRVGPGPAIRVGRTGSWWVTTVRVGGATWFGWATARLTGDRLVRDGGPAPAAADPMETSQTHAVLVAAQLAAGRAPLGVAGIQVTGAAGGLRPGDVLLAAGDGRAMVPLHRPGDLENAGPRVLVVPADGTSWGRAEIERLPAGVRAGAAVSAVAYPLDGVRGPSAGLMLALARVDALTSGDLTGGRRVAGTGAIGLDGAVADVGDVPEKIEAAVASGAQVFLVPYRQAATAARAARGRLRVAGVRSVSAAVHWLCATGGHSTACWRE